MNVAFNTNFLENKSVKTVRTTEGVMYQESIRNNVNIHCLDSEGYNSQALVTDLIEMYKHQLD